MYPGESLTSEECQADLSDYDRWVRRLKEEGFLQRGFKKPGGIRSVVRKEDAGRLASSVEGGGKRRIFAIGNFVKQCLLRGPHNWGRLA